MDKKPTPEASQENQDKPHQNRVRLKWFILLGSVVVVIVAVVLGLMLLFSSKKTYDSVPATTPTKETAKKDPSKLDPYGLGTAPYAYIPWQGSLDEARAESDAKTFMAAFIVNASGQDCTPAWDGDVSLGLDSQRSTEIAQDMARLRTNGGDVVLSFGGATGTELAQGCKDSAALKIAYARVIDTYQLNKIDLDIEKDALADTASNDRRADALASLQQDKPNLKIWLTLAVMPTGLDQENLDLIKQMQSKGVVISGVNIMVMDYGQNTVDMGQAAISAATATFAQLKTLYPNNTDAEIWKTLGLTPMIGVNDTTPETFTLQDAQKLRDFATQKGVGMLSQWNIDRDKSCPNNAAELSDSCSGVTQTPYQFVKALYIDASK